VEASVSLSPVPSAFLEVAAQAFSTARWAACLVELAAIQVWVSTVFVAQALALHSDSLWIVVPIEGHGGFCTLLPPLGCGTRLEEETKFV
jgi:hypothetical protein